MVVVWRYVPLSLALWGSIYMLFGWRGVVATFLIAVGLLISAGAFD
jgi:hypothetical protein